MSTPAAEQLVTLDDAVEIRNLEKVIPYAMARDIVIRGPDRIVALECPCRAARDAPCLPLDVCLIVGEPFASFVADHNPRRARWITQDEAVAILRAERDRGHVHHAFFKDAMLGRFYAICNCCACCCGACAAQCPFGAVTLEARTPRVDVQVCMGCGVCVAQCPTGAVSLVRTPEKGEPLEIRELIGS
jgi:ferredoxin